MNLSLLIATVVLLMAMSFLFSGSETALFSLSKSELYSFSISKRKSENSLASLMKRPQNILVTLLTGNLLVNNFLTSLVTDYLLIQFPDFGPLISIGIVTPVLIVLCEMLPKLLSVREPHLVARSVSTIIYLVHILLLPITFILHTISNAVVYLLHLSSNESSVVTEHEIESVLSSHEQFGYLSPEESSFIRNVLNFSKKDAKNVMMPRNTALTIDYSSSISDVLALVKSDAPQRIPVYKQTPDTIIGMIDTRDLVPFAAGIKKGRSISPILQPVAHYPESKELGELLSDFVTGGIQMAVLVDEYGGTSGFVTLSSIISEVMGDNFALDEVKTKKEVWKVNNRTIVSADMQLHDFNQQFNDIINSYESETVGGYITERLGHFPRKGESVSTDVLKIRVRSVGGNKIKTVEVEGL